MTWCRPRLCKAARESRTHVSIRSQTRIPLAPPPRRPYKQRPAAVDARAVAVARVESLGLAVASSAAKEPASCCHRRGRRRLWARVTRWRSTIVFTHVQVTSYSLRVSTIKSRHLATLLWAVDRQQATEEARDQADRPEEDECAPHSSLPVTCSAARVEIAARLCLASDIPGTARGPKSVVVCVGVCVGAGRSVKSAWHLSSQPSSLRSTVPCRAV